MKKIILLALPALFLFQGTGLFAQCKKTSFQALEQKHNAQSVPVYFLDGKPFTGSTYDEYAHNQICREFEIVDGLIQKQSGWYFDGVKEREFSYRDGVLHGMAVSFHRNGNKYVEENYMDGMSDGKQFRYNCDGSLQAEWHTAAGLQLINIHYEKKACLPGCKMDDC